MTSEGGEAKALEQIDETGGAEPNRNLYNFIYILCMRLFRSEWDLFNYLDVHDFAI